MSDYYVEAVRRSRDTRATCLRSFAEKIQAGKRHAKSGRRGRRKNY